MAGLTELAPNSRPHRRYSESSKDSHKPHPRNGKARSASGDGTVTHHPNREAVILAPVPEDAQVAAEETHVLTESIGSSDEEEEEEDEATPTTGPPGSSQAKQRRRSSRLSWIPGWSFAGSGPLTPPNSPPREEPNSLYRTTSADSAGENANNNFNVNSKRLSRLRSSISVISEVVIRDTAPTHESNFSANPTFPTSPGHILHLHVYGSIDSLSATDMRLQIPTGFAYADFTATKQYQAVLEYIRPLLQDGDLLVRPFIERYARDRYAAMVVRGAIQDCVFKCFVVGVFPMKMFLPAPEQREAEQQEGGMTKGRFASLGLESYELEVQLYDSESLL